MRVQRLGVGGSGSRGLYRAQDIGFGFWGWVPIQANLTVA